MKKNFLQKFLAPAAILLFALAFSSTTSALTFYTKSYNGYFQNNTPSPLNQINVQADKEAEIKAENGIAIIIPQTLKITFDIKNRSIKFSGNALAKVDIDNYKYSDDGKTLYLPVKIDFAKDDVISMDNVIVRIYQLSTGFEQLGIDTNSDGKVDKVDSNFTQVSQSDSSSDVTPPYEITKFTSKIIDGKTVLNWIWPPDLDFYKLEISNNDTNEKQTIYSQDKNEMTLSVTPKKGFSAVVFDLQGLSSKSVDSMDITSAPAVDDKITTESTAKENTPPPEPKKAEATTSKPEFTDISDHWSKDIVISMAGKNIIKGYEDHTFRPDDKITRAEAAAILYRVLGIAEPTLPSETGFKDIKSDDWVAGYVLELKTRSIVKGYAGNTFHPNVKITRAEFLQLAINTLLNKSTEDKRLELKKLLEQTGTTEFSDLKKDDWYFQIATFARGKGYMEGKSCGNNKCFDGNSSITRAEALKILAKIFFTE